MLFNLIRKWYNNHINLDARIYRGNSLDGYKTWKEKTFGTEICERLEEKNNLEGRLWEKRNNDVVNFYNKYEVKKPKYENNYNWILQRFSYAR